MVGNRSEISYLERGDIIARLNHEFAIFDPTYRAEKDLLGAELADLSAEVLAIQQRGLPLFRSDRILKEAVWLHHYTADWGRLARRLEDLRRSLTPRGRDRRDQRELLPEADGSFGGGATEFFMRLDATTDAVQCSSVTVDTPLTFLEPVLDPGRLLATLHRLQISTIRSTGRNHRAELASLESSLLQFFGKATLQPLLRHPRLWPSLGSAEIDERVRKVEETFQDFIDQTQHPRTGYWGPWYLMGDTLLQLHDLSFTFHVVNFRRTTPVAHWPEIIRTTLSIRDRVYPYGWKPSDSASTFSNHHNMDVVTLLRQGFRLVDEPTRTAIGDAVFDMLEWCLTSSLRQRLDDFAPVDEEDTLDRLSFGIFFLEKAGFWSSQPFWWDPTRPRPAAWPSRYAVASALLKAVAALGATTSFTDDVGALLRPVVAESGGDPVRGLS